MSAKPTRSRARCPRRSRDTPSTHPWGLDGGIHAANGPASGEDTAPERWSVARKAAHRRKGGGDTFSPEHCELAAPP
ncbi:hypothetical protein XACW160_300006 [Xanthomonas citri pv. citri]|uniref:Uncharacterized protein n=1 Tax=Xanthomonas citri pv. citri TaxID=611301 RepID=A0A0U5FFP1_XANCI|nr:hypothetical protein XAC3824_260006 [Xanthomonas citri pv. citri]CEE21407.1 hypothetical protein XAC9322_240006 [Xanthomonas citri pv. citri]CEE22975.1 hypothetical protein XAC1083_230005 [Xanthomonas citri pv. citri]CEE33911.1 hypothetical protein XAC902_320006 [Xanthomonas citri pv. citri]CEE34388.1 hypothetical protein XAC2911_250005 [Xanthomonas citri pv. citri]